MGLNVGYLTAATDKASDEVFTPRYAVTPIVKYIKKDSVIWCPFDEEDSEYVKVLRENGFKVIATHIINGQNFFEYEPEEYDVIISNPPFSIKDDILKRLDELKKPYAMLLPLPTLQGQKRFKYLKNTEALIFDKRVNFFKDKTTKEIMKGISFASIYICKDFLPQKLIFEELNMKE
jgi:type I restriction-modification system DNA methylase subunit